MKHKFKLGPRRNNSIIASLLGAAICLSLAATGLYIALTGEELKGGIPFLPRALNQAFGRVAFGSAALLVGMLGVYALFEAITLLRERRSSR